tara:strand:- start:21146 stop:22933 length:1788 start_codon:yes stop_codon:yes gene_type:complete
MVSFNWAGNDQSLPQSANFFVTEMQDYISGKERKFVFRLNAALDDTSLDESTRDELKGEFKKVLDKILDQPLRPLLEEEVAGFKKFIQDRKSSRKNKEGETEDVDMVNESNVEFISKKTIKDLMSSNVTNRLKGMGSIEHGKNLEKLPPFDFDDFLQAYLNVEPSISVELGFTEGIDKEGNPTGKYTYAHKKSVFGTSQDNHIEAEIPSIDVGDLEIAQADWLKDTTGQNAGTKKATGKNKTFKEVYDYNLVLPEKVLEELGGDTDASKDSGFVEYKLSPKGKQFSQTGTKVVFGKDEAIESTAEFMALTGKQRTDLMVKENMVEKEGKYYKLVGGSNTSSGSVENRIVRADYKETDANSPYSFIKEKAEEFMAMHRRFLDDPLTVHTLSVVANIKTQQKDKDSFLTQASEQNAKEPTDANPEPARYEKLIFVNLNNKKKISEKEWDNLESNEQSAYKGEMVNLTSAEIANISDTAFRHKNDGTIISEFTYNHLEREEKSNYISNTRVFAGQDDNKTSYSDMDAYSGKKYSGPSVTYETAAEAFSKSIIICQFTINTHLKFNMHPFQNKGANMDLSTYINKRKIAIDRLQNILGE